MFLRVKGFILISTLQPSDTIRLISLYSKYNYETFPHKRTGCSRDRGTLNADVGVQGLNIINTCSAQILPKVLTQSLRTKLLCKLFWKKKNLTQVLVGCL